MECAAERSWDSLACDWRAHRLAETSKTHLVISGFPTMSGSCFWSLPCGEVIESTQALKTKATQGLISCLKEATQGLISATQACQTI